MADKDFFDNPEAVFNQKGLSSSRKSVIKNNTVRVGDKKRIDHKSDDHTDMSEPEVQPIVENDQIVGIFYKCSCGKLSEIRFDFDN